MPACPIEEMEWECAGVNHLAWFTKLAHQGKDLYSSVLYKKFAKEVEEGVKEAEAGLAPTRPTDAPRQQAGGKDLEARRSGTQGYVPAFRGVYHRKPGHLSEYLPYYRKNAEGRKLLRPGYDGGSRFYASNWPNWRAGADAYAHRLVNGEETVETGAEPGNMPRGSSKPAKRIRPSASTAT